MICTAQRQPWNSGGVQDDSLLPYVLQLGQQSTDPSRLGIELEKGSIQGARIASFKIMVQCDILICIVKHVVIGSHARYGVCWVSVIISDWIAPKRAAAVWQVLSYVDAGGITLRQCRHCHTNTILQINHASVFFPL